MRILWSIIGLLMICPLLAQSGRQGADRKAWADSSLARLRRTLARDPTATVATTDSLLRVFKKQGDACACAETYGLRSVSFVDLGTLDSAMVCAQQVFRSFPPGCDSTVLLRGYVAMSKLYLSLGELAHVDSICGQGLALWRPAWKASVLRNALLTNRAIAGARSGDLDAAERSFRTILHYAQVEGNAQDVDDASTNLGVVKSMKGQLDSAAYYYRSAMASARAKGKWGRIALHYSNLAVLAERRGQFTDAIQDMDSARVYAERAGDLSLQINIHKGLAHYYEQLGRYRDAFSESQERYSLNDSLLNIEKVKAIAETQEKYESEKKAREIQALRADKLSIELDKSRVMRTRNIYLFAGLGIAGLSLGLWNMLRRTRRSRAAIRKERDISDGLLLNILPAEVAAEIKTKGYADVREFPTATVLFTDFKGFTGMAEKLPPAALVAEIDLCFKAFDGIMEKYGIEKIKTIGDAYMAAGGLPDTGRGTPLEVVRAALEMQRYMAAYKAERQAAGQLFFEMRLGIHTGPVIAGIVGVKKYAYDIWGDTVNTASRMESSGAVGRVNISGSTYELVKQATDLRFTERGLVQAKGKGDLHMYFVGTA